MDKEFRIDQLNMPALSAEEMSVPKIGDRFVTSVAHFHSDKWLSWNSSRVEACDRCERHPGIFGRFGCCGIVHGGGDVFVVFCKHCHKQFCDMDAAR